MTKSDTNLKQFPDRSAHIDMERMTREGLQKIKREAAKSYSPQILGRMIHELRDTIETAEACITIVEKYSQVFRDGEICDTPELRRRISHEARRKLTDYVSRLRAHIKELETKIHHGETYPPAPATHGMMQL